MKKDYNMKKKLVIGGLSLAVVCLVTGLYWYLGKIDRSEAPIQEPAETATEAAETVTEETQSESKDAADSEMDVQQPQTKVETEKPESKPEPVKEDAGTNPEAPPQYEPEVTAPKEQPKEPEGGAVNEAGQIYVPGFGYVDNPGPPISIPADTSGGDWNKQIGEM